MDSAGPVHEGHSDSTGPKMNEQLLSVLIDEEDEYVGSIMGL